MGSAQPRLAYCAGSGRRLLWPSGKFLSIGPTWSSLTSCLCFPACRSGIAFPVDASGEGEGEGEGEDEDGGGGWGMCAARLRRAARPKFIRLTALVYSLSLSLDYAYSFFVLFCFVLFCFGNSVPLVCDLAPSRSLLFALGEPLQP